MRFGGAAQASEPVLLVGAQQAALAVGKTMRHHGRSKLRPYTQMPVLSLSELVTAWGGKQNEPVGAAPARVIPNV